MKVKNLQWRKHKSPLMGYAHYVGTPPGDAPGEYHIFQEKGGFTWENDHDNKPHRTRTMRTAKREAQRDFQQRILALITEIKE